MTRQEAIEAAYNTYNDAINAAYKVAYNDAYDAYKAELARINKEYPK